MPEQADCLAHWLSLHRRSHIPHDQLEFESQPWHLEKYARHLCACLGSPHSGSWRDEKLEERRLHFSRLFSSSLTFPVVRCWTSQNMNLVLVPSAVIKRCADRAGLRADQDSIPGPMGLKNTLAAFTLRFLARWNIGGKRIVVWLGPFVYTFGINKMHYLWHKKKIMIWVRFSFEERCL